MPEFNEKGDKPKQLKELIKQEYLRCATDPIYFITKYCFIQAEEGRMLFDTYDFQVKLVNLFRKYKRISIVKSRQLGITTICAAYALWTILFHSDKKVVCLAPTQEKSRFIVDKVTFSYDNLPSWMKTGPGSTTEKQKLSIALQNGSSIKAISGDSNAARGFTAHLLIIDEAAFIDNAEELWGSSQNTLNESKGTAIVLSTPKGIGNWFHKNHMKGENGENDFVPVKLPWTVHPKRDQAWRDNQVKEFNGNERLARQECDAVFESSGHTVLLPETIEWYKDNYQSEPREKRGPLQDYWIWEYPVAGREYVLISDVSRGDGQDYSTLQVIDLFNHEQVAEYNGQPDTKELAKFLVTAAIEYNSGLLIIERESIGWSVVKDVLETRYPNLYFSPKEGMVMDEEIWLNRGYDYDTNKMTPGFSTNVKFRPLVISSFIGAIERKEIIIHSKRTIDQWRTFIYNSNNKATAAKGFNDDLVLPIGIYEFIRDTAMRFSKNAKELSKSAIAGIRLGSVTTVKQVPAVTDNHTTRPLDSRYRQAQPMYNNKNGKNPFVIKVGKQDEDIRWLF